MSRMVQIVVSHNTSLFRLTEANVETYPFHTQRNTSHLRHFYSLFQHSLICGLKEFLLSSTTIPTSLNVCKVPGSRSWRTSSDQDIIMNAIVDNKGTLVETSTIHEAHSFFWSLKKNMCRLTKTPTEKNQNSSGSTSPRCKPLALALAKNTDS